MAVCLPVTYRHGRRAYPYCVETCWPLARAASETVVKQEAARISMRCSCCGEFAHVRPVILAGHRLTSLSSARPPAGLIGWLRWNWYRPAATGTATCSPTSMQAVNAGCASDRRHHQPARHPASPALPGRAPRHQHGRGCGTAGPHRVARRRHWPSTICTATRPTTRPPTSGCAAWWMPAPPLKAASRSR